MFFMQFSRKLFKKSIFTSLLLALVSAASAQKTNDPFVNDFVSRVWTASDGLPANSITDVIQKDDGYIYLGSYDGLVRFDGVEFLTINKNTNPNFSFVSARTLFQDSKKNFWLGANDEGVTVIAQDGKIRRYDTTNGLPNNSVRSFAEDKNGRVWVGTSSGICVIDGETVISLKGMDTLPEGGHILVRSMFCDSAGRMWVCSPDDAGLLLYAENKFTRYDNFKKIKNPQVSEVMQDSSGAFWFGIAPHYALCFDGMTETLYDLGFGARQGTLVTSIYQDSHENMWFGLDSGIAVLHGGKLSFMAQNNGLTDEKVSSIMEDREGNIWISTDRGGIQRLGQTKFKTTPLPTSINAICYDKKRESLWLGGDSGLLCLQNNKLVTNEVTEYCKNVRVRHVSLTDKNELLISTYEKLGQVVVSQDGKITSYSKQDGYLTGNKTRVALRTSGGDLYVGTTNGLSIIDGKTGAVQFITKDFGVKNEYIMCLYEGADGSIWCGTDGGGVFVLKDRKLAAAFTTEDGLAGNVVFKISSLKEDEIWICTGTGISRYKNGQFFNFNAGNGMGTDSVFQMIPDYTGKIWCTSNKGIFSVKLADLENVADGKLDRVRAKFYGHSDGIVSGGVTSTSLSVKDELGRIWFTLIDGIVMYDPVRSSSNVKAPIVDVQEVAVDNNRFIPKGEYVVIPPFGKRFSIKYTGLSFVSPEQVQFKYKLEGFDKEYSEWSTARSVSYTNLKPGSYKFTVIAINNDDVESQPSDTLLVVKRAAFWQRIWFWIFVALLAGVCAYFIAKLRIEKLEKDNQRLQQIYVEVTQALTGTIDAKDKYTNGHSSRVALYSKMLAERMGLSAQEQENIYMQAILHDIGKIGVPDTIINKPGKLTDEEYEVIKTHPVIGSDILKSITSLKGIEVGARSHHERYDGKGYPDGLKGEEIPLAARIIGVADAYDAMTSNRSYRNYLSQEVVREQIEKGKGTQFDPEVAACMLEIMEEDTDYFLHG